MSEEAVPLHRLAELQHQIDVLLETPLDFVQVDPETTHRKVRLLSAVAAYLNVLSLAEFGGRTGAERQLGLVEQVVAAAFQTFAGVDPHPDPFDKAGMLFRGITQGHPFQDANKRTGFLLATYYLAQMGYEPVDPVPEDQLVELAFQISAGQIRDIEQIANALRPVYRPDPDRR